MAQINIKQVRGASQGSILFLGTNSVVEDWDKLRWNEDKLVLNGQLQITDGTQNDGWILISDNNGNASWTSSSVISNQYIYVTSSYSILNTDYYIDANGTFDVTLPTAVGLSGRTFIIKNTGTGIITVQTTGSETIDNLPSYNLGFYDTVDIESNGSDWLLNHPSTKRFTRVYNDTGSIIYKGTALTVQSAFSGIPSITLPIATNHTGNNEVIGLAYIDIPDNSEGIVVSAGIISGLNLSAYNIGDVLYLSDTVPGGLTASTAGLQFGSRSNKIGYVTSNSPTVGTIQVEINNEDSNLTLTDIERNILEGNVISTGVYEYSPGITRLSATTFSVSTAKGWIVNNTSEYATSPDVQHVVFAGATGLSTPYLTSASSTYILLNASSSLVMQSTFPTPQERRENIYLGKVVHPDKTAIQNVNNVPDFDVSPVSMIRDLWTPIKLINQGVLPRPNSDLTFQMSSGTLWGNGINWVNNQLNPDSVFIASKNPVTFQYRTQTGTQSAFTDRTTIDTTNYDVNGVVTSISGAQYTNQRVYLFPTSVVRIQYGQQEYTTLAKAITGILSEPFVEYVNNADNGILVGVITVKNGASNLNNTNDCQFTLVSKFGELLGGAAGGVSTTSLQGTYDNSSVNPEILTNATLGAVNIRRGSTSDSDNVLTIQNNAGTDTVSITGDGHLNVSGGVTVSGTVSTTNLRVSNSPQVGWVLTSDSIGNASWQPTGTVNGSGTINYVPRWIQSGTLSATGSIYDTGSKVGIGITNSNYVLAVTGTSSILNIIGTQSSNQNLLAVDGVNGRLMEINDTSDYYLVVNDNAGSDVMKISPDEDNSGGSSIYIGNTQWNPKSLYTTREVLNITTTQSVYRFATSSWTSAYIDYVVGSGSNIRSGVITAVFGGGLFATNSLIESSLGSTTDYKIGFTMSATYSELIAWSTGGSFDFRGIIRSL